MKKIRYASAVAITAAVVALCAFLPALVGKVDEGRQTAWEEPVRELEFAVEEQDEQSLSDKFAMLTYEDMKIMSVGDAAEPEILQRTKELLDELFEMGVLKQMPAPGEAEYHKYYIYHDEASMPGFFVWEVMMDFGRQGSIAFVIEDESLCLMNCGLHTTDEKTGIFNGALTDWSQSLVSWYTWGLRELGGSYTIGNSDENNPGYKSYYYYWEDEESIIWRIEMIVDSNDFSVDYAESRGDGAIAPGQESGVYSHDNRTAEPSDRRYRTQ